MASQGGAIERLPADLAAQLRAALAWVRAGQAKAALPDLEALRDQLHELDPGLGALAGSHLAEALVATGHRGRAVQVLGEDAARVRAPEYADVRARLLMQAAPLHPDGEFGLQLAAEADRLAASLDDPAPRVQTIETLLYLLDRHGADTGVREVADGLAVQARAAGDRPAEVRGLLRVALWDRAHGRPDRALEVARKAHAAAALLAPDQAALTAEAAALRGTLARQNGEALEAVECLDQALLAQPEPDDHTRVERALAALALGLHPAHAAAELERSTMADDAAVAARARRALALHYLVEGDLQRADSAARGLQGDDAKAIGARLLLARGRAAEALPVLHELAQAAPDETAVQLSLAQALRVDGKPLDSLGILDGLLQAAIDRGDGATELQVRLARGPVFSELGDFESCRQDARRAAELAEERHLPLHHAVARTQVAFALAQLDLAAEAVAELDQATMVADRVGAHAAAAQAALLAAVLESLPVRDGLQGRPLAVFEAWAQAGPSRLLATLGVALARRALVVDDDPVLAAELCDRAEATDTDGRLTLAIAQLRALFPAEA